MPATRGAVSRPNQDGPENEPQGSSPYSRPRPAREQDQRAPAPDEVRNTEPPTAVRPIVPVDEPDEDAPTELRPGLGAELPPLPEAPPPRRALPPPALPPAPRRFESVAPTALALQTPAPRSSAKALLATLGLMAGLCVGGAAGTIALWHHAKATTPPEVAAPPVAASTARPSHPLPPVACRLAHHAVELRPTVRAQVPLYAAPLASSGRVALGYADSEYGAKGLDVAPTTLQAHVSLSRLGVVPVDGVVPFDTRAAAGFAIDRNDAGLESAHTVPARIPFRIGYSDGTLSRLAPGDTPRPIWTGLAHDKPTGLRTASVSGVGFAVTFRLGGEQGQVMLGWLSPEGARKSPLGAIDISAAALGTPSIASNGKKVALAVATRESARSPWGIRIATAAAGELPIAAHYFALPGGGPGHDAFAPTLTGLSNGRWLIQWTEGTPRHRVVRVQTLASDLSPVGAAITLSPSGANAGQGVVQSSAGQAVGFYLIKGRHGYQLWASSLDCGRR